MATTTETESSAIPTGDQKPSVAATAPKKGRPIFKGHPKDGKRRFDYVQRKIEFLRQIGLVERKSTGLGMNGGASPDHLTKAQEEERREWRKRRDRELERAAALVAHGNHVEQAPSLEAKEA